VNRRWPLRRTATTGGSMSLLLTMRVQRNVQGGEDAEDGGLNDADEGAERVERQRQKEREEPREDEQHRVIADHVARETKREGHGAHDDADDLDAAEERR